MQIAVEFHVLTVLLAFHLCSIYSFMRGMQGILLRQPYLKQFVSRLYVYKSSVKVEQQEDLI